MLVRMGTCEDECLLMDTCDVDAGATAWAGSGERTKMEGGCRKGVLDQEFTQVIGMFEEGKE